MSTSSNPYRQSKYLLSAHNSQQFPLDTGHEVAFVGRSNVGKSSVINSITDQKRLAKTSKTPGRTRQINFFTVHDDIRLVDLPGYGFSRVDRTLKKQWDELITDYFANRQSLVGLVLIMDSRREVSREDEDMIHWCQTINIPVHILINKADKLPYQQRKRAMDKFTKYFERMPLSLQLYSAMDKTGSEEAIGVLTAWLSKTKQGPGNE